MSQIYLIQYNVKEELILEERIKSLGTWMNYFPKSLIIESDLPAKEIYNKISLSFEKDKIFIIELSKTNFWGIMPKEAWEWIISKR